MKYKLTAARLMASTYGPEFHPTMRQPVTILAENLDDGAAVQQVLNACRKTWVSSETQSPAGAMTEAREALAAALGASALGGAWGLDDNEPAYRPIYDDAGVEIGHDTVAWLSRDDEPVTKEFATPLDGLELGLVGCVFISIGQI